jgi:hypothetical protein
MSDSKPAETPPSDQRERRTRSFRKHAPVIRLSPEQLRRQNDVLRCAWRNLSGARPVIAFLNTHNESLGGQPLHVALHSDEGLLRVETLLSETTLRT